MRGEVSASSHDLTFGGGASSQLARGSPFVSDVVTLPPEDFDRLRCIFTCQMTLLYVLQLTGIDTLTRAAQCVALAYRRESKALQRQMRLRKRLLRYAHQLIGLLICPPQIFLIY